MDYSETFTPVTSIRLLFAISTSLTLFLTRDDFVSTFQNVKIPKNVIYFLPPSGINCSNNEVWKLRYVLCGFPNLPCCGRKPSRRVSAGWKFQLIKKAYG